MKKLVDDLADARNQMKLLLSELYLGNEQKDIHPLDMKTLYPTYEQVVNSWLELNNTLDNISQNGDNVVKAKVYLAQILKQLRKWYYYYKLLLNT